MPNDWQWQEGWVEVESSSRLGAPGAFETMVWLGDRMDFRAEHLARLHQATGANPAEMEAWLDRVCTILPPEPRRVKWEYDPLHPTVRVRPLLPRPSSRQLERVFVDYDAIAPWKIGDYALENRLSSPATTLLVAGGQIRRGATSAVFGEVDGVLHAPGPASGVMDSISRRWILQRLERADLEVRDAPLPAAVGHVVLSNVVQGPTHGWLDPRSRNERFEWYRDVVAAWNARRPPNGR